MANGAVYVVLAILVVIITVTIWNRQKVDTYSRIGGCQIQCQSETGDLKRNLCIQKCLGHQIIKYANQKCSKDDDCQTSQVCILKGFYTGRDGNVFPNLNTGYCMDENEPGAIQWERQSSFQKPHLPDHHHDYDGSSIDPNHHHDDVTSHSTYTFNLTGDITPSKTEAFGPQVCLPGMYWNAYARSKGGQGGQCEKIYQGRSSAWSVKHQQPDFPTDIDYPGTTLPGYGVGYADPFDKPSGVSISSDPGFNRKKK